MNAMVVIFFCIILLQLALATLVAVRQWHERSSRLFFVMVMLSVVWMLSNYFENEIGLFGSNGTAFLLRFDFSSAIIWFLFIFLFAKSFLVKGRFVSVPALILWTVPAVFYAIASWTDLTIQQIQFKDNIIAYKEGPLATGYVILLLTYMFGAILILVRKSIKFRGIERKQALFVLFGLGITILNAVGINLIWQTYFPQSLTLDISRLGLYGFVVFVICTTYAIVRHQLLDVRVIATEFLAGALIFISFAEMLLAGSFADFVYKTFIFLAVSIFGFSLIRSVVREIRRREEIQRLADQLKRANERLQELSEMKSNFISIASHQLRAPIGGVRGYLSMLRDGDYGPLPKKVDDLLDLNLDSLNHTLHVIETFLNVTRLEAGKVDIQKEPVDICVMIRDIYKELKLTAERKRIRLVMSCDAKKVALRADKEKLRNVLFNLVENALKYTERGTIKTTVVPGKTVEVRVTDTGIGIEPAEVPKLFAKFVRAGGGLKISHGSGLGLYIVKTLVEAHNGTVFVESPGPGKGSTFGFRIPAGRV